MQQASYLEGGPLLWILPLYLHINKKSDDDDDDDDVIQWIMPCYKLYYPICLNILVGTYNVIDKDHVSNTCSY